MPRQATKRPRLTAFDRRLLGEAPAVAGVDEAGRGALAGPVVAGAVHLSRDFYDTAACRKLRPLVRDSKQRTAEQREAAFAALGEASARGGLVFATGAAGVEEIETLNILGATRLAMKRALDTLLERAGYAPDIWQEVEEGDLFFESSGDPRGTPRRPLILVDGLPLRPFFYPHQAVVQGDARSFAIAAASIVAKVTRDALMADLEEQFADYGFAGHKGYGTPAHLEAIHRLGPCAQHRTVFLRKILIERVEKATVPLFEEFV